MDITRINPGPRWSDITVYNGIGHFVEVAESDTRAGIERQTQQIFAQAEESLAKIGSNKDRILSATIYLTDFAHFNQFNEQWDAWFNAGTAPSRACIKVELADPDLLLEIAFVVAAQEA